MKQPGIPSELTTELRDAAARITTVEELRAYAARFPSPQAGQIILEALDFLSEPKVVNGKRDGKKIFKHVNLGYGPRLKGNENLRSKRDWRTGRPPLRDILIALILYAEKKWPITHEMSSHEKITHKKSFGVEEPQELVYKFVNLLSD
jgi:hypothetical protein